MTELLAGLIGLVIGTLLGAGLTGGLTYGFRLRRELKAAQKALETRESVPEPVHVERVGNALAYIGGEPATSTPPAGFAQGAVGPSAIQAREIYEREKAKQDQTPKFASPKTLNPDLKDIQDAAREATENGRLN